MALATCGWCKAKNIPKENGEDGKGLETHKIPGTYKTCQGQSTAPGYQRREKK